MLRFLSALALASCLSPCFADSSVDSLTPLKPEVAQPSMDCTAYRTQILEFNVAKDFSKSMKQIGREQTGLNAFNSKDDGFGLGMVAARPTVRVSASNVDGGCRTFGIQLGFTDVVLSVAKELKSNTCAFNHVHRHELVHIAIYEKFLTDSLPARIQTRLASIQDRLTAMPDDAAITLVRTELVNELRAVYKEHNALDSDEEYAENGHACGGAIRRIVMRM